MNKITTKTYGNLLLDEIIFADYEPIIFTVKDSQNDLYICARIYPNPKELLIKKCSPQLVIDLLTNRITFRQAFIGSLFVTKKLIPQGSSSSCYAVGIETYEYPDEFLPDDETIMADEHEFDDIINEYKEIIYG